jgi:hypothetical protein
MIADNRSGGRPALTAYDFKHAITCRDCPNELCGVVHVAFWPFASFRGRAAISSILERSGHRLAGKIDRFGRE